MAEYVGNGAGDCDTVGTTGGSANWDCTEVWRGGTGNDTNDNDITIDSTGKPWVSWRDDNTDDGKLWVASYVGTAGQNCDGLSETAGGSDLWDCTQVFDGDHFSDGYRNRITMGPDDTPWVVFSDVEADASDIMVAEYVGGSDGNCNSVGGTAGSADWDCTRVFDGNGINDGYDSPDIFVANDGTPWISFRNNEPNDELIVAKYVGTTGQDCDTLGGAAGSDLWDCEVVFNDSANVGFSTSIAEGPDGAMWTVFSNENTNDGKVYLARYLGDASGNCDTLGASGGSDNWECTEVYDGTLTNAGIYNSLAFDTMGRPWVSFYVPATDDGQLWVSHFERQGEITISPSLGSSNWDTLSESHADMTSSSDTTNRDDSDCISAGASWNNGTFMEAGNGSKLAIGSGTGTAQCTELAWTIDTSQAVAGETYRFVVATKDAFRSDKGSWRGPITVATDGYPTLSIRDSAEQEYRYSKDSIAMGASDCTNTDWACWDVSTTGMDGLDTSIAVDQSGDMWVSFVDDEFNITVAKYVGSGGDCDDSAWECTIVELGGVAIDKYNVTSLAVSPDGTIWLSYRNDSDNDLMVAKYVGSGGSNCNSSEWECTTVTSSTGDPGDEPDMAFDVSGNPWIIHHDSNPNYDSYIAHYVGGTDGTCDSDSSWDCDALETHATVEYGDKPAIASDSSGKMWATYEKTDGADNTLRLAEYVGSGGTGCNGGNTQWTCTDLDNTVGTRIPSIVVDSSDKPIIAYYADVLNDLVIAEYVGGGTGSGCTDSNWTCTTLDDTTNDVGEEASIAIDSEGNPWIVHRDASNDRLRLARKVGSGGTGCASGVTAWTCEDIDYATVETPRDMSIAFDMDGLPWVSWQDGDDDLGVLGADLKVSKLKMPIYQPSNINNLKWTSKNAGTGDLRYLLTSGLAPYTDSYGDCGGVANMLGYCGLHTNDGNYDSLTTGVEERPMYSLATKFSSNSDVPSVNAYFRTDTSPATHNVVLQVYRFGTTNAWETVTTYSTAGCSTDNCGLNGQPSGTPSEYFETIGSDYWIYFRIYQTENTSSITFKLDSFRADVIQSYLRHGSVYREESHDSYNW